MPDLILVRSTGPLVGGHQAYAPITGGNVHLSLHGYLTAAVIISPLWGAAFRGGAYLECGVMAEVSAQCALPVNAIVLPESII